MHWCLFREILVLDWEEDSTELVIFGSVTVKRKIWSYCDR